MRRSGRLSEGGMVLVVRFLGVAMLTRQGDEGGERDATNYTQLLKQGVTSRLGRNSTLSSGRVGRPGDKSTFRPAARPARKS